MLHQLRSRFRVSVLAHTASSAILALALCSCQTSLSDVTGSIGGKAEADHTDPQRDLDVYRDKFRAAPKDVNAALQYGRALRAAGQRSQAVAVLEQATIANPSNKQLLAEYGRALADNGNFEQAFDVLSQAHSPEDPDWRILSAQGAALDQLGRFEDARRYYASALKIAPDEPTVLSNLGLSYLLSKDLPKAEEILRRASGRSDDPRVRQNLALVIGLQGRFAEAGKLLQKDRPAEEAAANLKYLKKLLAAQKENARAEAVETTKSATAEQNDVKP
jgi:Flp pilus assembly protein TadD